MTNTEQLRKNMLDKIKELFQLDQPDLDFGFYRIMHSRAKEITEFIEHDLLDTVKSAFDSAKVESSQADFEAAKAKVIDAIGDDAFDGNGALKAMYANSKAGKEFLAAQRKLADSGTILSGEDSVYYHLYRFFSRYYKDGDFISMRYHTRETDDMAKPYAVPYGGEEVMLHWANADQYYIKTAENFRNFSFDLTKAKLFEAMGREEKVLAGVSEHPLTVHFKVVEAEEGEHGNIKADPNQKREFFLAPEQMVALNHTGELEIHFEYRVAEESDALTPADETLVKELYGAKNKGDFKLLAMTAKIMSACHDLKQRMLDEHADATLISDFITVMEYACPTDAVKKRILLSKYLYQYTARNTSDYFIHKNLRGFLRREMDFYIKNEIMNLDDVENSDVSGVENYLVLLKVFRKIAGKLIDFLGQLEDFQKKLWLKKKFVVQCDYCITLDRVPEEFYPEIAKNEQQRKEWVRLYSIDQIIASSGGYVRGGSFINAKGQMDKTNKRAPERKFAYSLPLSIGFLGENRFLMVDTKFFSADFKARLLAKIDNFDDQCDGLLIHSENFQALNLLQERYREQVKCIYIDPPYNTGSDGFAYKDNYQSSSWLSCLGNRIAEGRRLLRDDGSQFTSIGDEELDNLRELYSGIWTDCYKSTIIVRRGIKNVQAQFETINALNRGYEFVLHHVKNPAIRFDKLMVQTSADEFDDDNDSAETLEGTWNNHWRGTDRPTMRYELFGITPDFGQWRWGEARSNIAIENYKRCCCDLKTPIPTQQQIDSWYDQQPSGKDKLDLLRLSSKGKPEHYIPPSNSKLASDIWVDLKPNGSKQLARIISQSGFETPKSTDLIDRLLNFVSYYENDVILDYFAGSGTTGTSVVDLNRRESIKRKYILIEMNGYFDTVLKPRLEKIVYSEKWKDGKPEEIPSIKGKHIIEESKKVLRNREGQEVDLLSFSTSYKGTEVEDNPQWNEHNPFNGVSHCFKYMRLESYEDTLNNLVMPETDTAATTMPPSLKEDYMLHYLLDTETRDSLLNIRDFSNPFGGYRLNIKQPDSDASVSTSVDLIETFHYLIGLRVEQYYRIQSYTADFKRSADPELPDNGAGQRTRLELAARPELDDKGAWRFQKIEGKIPANPLSPNDGQMKNVLILWRTLTGDLEQDNLMLDWYLGDTINLNEKHAEYDIIYVNGSNTLGADRKETESYQVRLIEEEFLKKMWSGEEY